MIAKVQIERSHEVELMDDVLEYGSFEVYINKNAIECPHCATPAEASKGGGYAQGIEIWAMDAVCILWHAVTRSA